MTEGIKEIKERDLICKIVIIGISDYTYPRIDIYKNEEYIGWIGWGYNQSKKKYCFFINIFNLSNELDVCISINSIKEMFEKLRLYIEISEKVEDEYERIFILYKLNNFKKL